MNKDIMNKLFPEEVKAVEDGRCPICREIVKEDEFNCPVSLKEFKISGMCQLCQDKTFMR